MLMNPALALVGKGLEVPKFTGVNFTDFSVKFPQFLRGIPTSGAPLNDATKFQFLQAGLDEASLIELQGRQERGPVQFQEFWNWFCARYGGDIQMDSLDELRRLKPKNDGRLKLADWRTYAAKFQQLYGRLENPLRGGMAHPYG